MVETRAKEQKLLEKRGMKKGRKKKAVTNVSMNGGNWYVRVKGKDNFFLVTETGAKNSGFISKCASP
jgi:hypothetical protein